MVRRRIHEKTRNRFKRAITDVIDGLSRKVTVYKKPIINECYNCFYDKATNSSTGKCKWTKEEADLKQSQYESSGGIGLRYKFFKFGRCPVCKGKGHNETQRKVYVDSLITWNPENRNSYITYTPAGTSGTILVELKADVRYEELFRECHKVVVDGVDCKLSKIPIIRGIGGGAVLVVTLFTIHDDNEKDILTKRY
jgi:hypothetical protein